jgi:coenzyme F420 biosynthesis associated uncharacterized protein
MSGTEMVDWELAVTTADRLLRPGPETSREQARQVVVQLREHAARAEQQVRQFTQLTAQGPPAPVLVIGRPAWVRANVDGFRRVLLPLTEKLRERRTGMPGGALVTTLGAKATGFEAGALLAYLASRVLGQFETFAMGPSAGRLLLVAPNIVRVERELGVDPTDFRLWVCLHEEAHRLQFTAVPWLRDHLEAEVHALLAETEIDPAALLRRARQGLQDAGLAGRAAGENVPRSLIELVQSPAQREIMARLTAVMSLLEGHAEYVMDGVGPRVVPSVAQIREKFERRREHGAGKLDLLLRRLLGMDVKLRQYRDGERFVRAVIERVGMEGFNRVWTSPNTLPTKAEIADADQWVARVHGRSPREG